MVKVRRIVADLAASNPGDVAKFYQAIFDLDVLMDMEWIVTLGADESAPVQLSLAQEGGSGAPVPHLSIEVDDLDTVLERVKARDVPIIYPVTKEPWGVRRFFIVDPGGRVLNVLSHI